MNDADRHLVDKKRTKEEDKHWPFSESTAKWLFWIGIAVILCTPIMFWLAEGFYLKGKIKSDIVAQFGDFIGGFVGSLWALAGVVLFYVALREQRKDFETNREILRAQLEEFKVQQMALQDANKVYQEQSKTARYQRFESSFFNLIDVFQKSVQSSFVTEYDKVYRGTEGYKVIYKMFRSSLTKGTHQDFHGFFRKGTQRFKELTPSTDEEGLRWLRESVSGLFSEVDSDFYSTVDQFYNIVEYVGFSNLISDKDRKFYLDVLHSTSGFHVVVICYLNSIYNVGARGKAMRMIRKDYGTPRLLNDIEDDYRVYFWKAIELEHGNK